MQSSSPRQNSRSPPRNAKAAVAPIAAANGTVPSSTSAGGSATSLLYTPIRSIDASSLRNRDVGASGTRGLRRTPSQASREFGGLEAETAVTSVHPRNQTGPLHTMKKNTKSGRLSAEATDDSSPDHVFTVMVRGSEDGGLVSESPTGMLSCLLGHQTSSTNGLVDVPSAKNDTAAPVNQPTTTTTYSRTASRSSLLSSSSLQSDGNYLPLSSSSAITTTTTVVGPKSQQRQPTQRAVRRTTADPPPRSLSQLARRGTSPHNGPILNEHTSHAPSANGSRAYSDTTQLIAQLPEVLSPRPKRLSAEPDERDPMAATCSGRAFVQGYMSSGGSNPPSPRGSSALLPTPRSHTTSVARDPFSPPQGGERTPSPRGPAPVPSPSPSGGRLADVDALSDLHRELEAADLATRAVRARVEEKRRRLATQLLIAKLQSLASASTNNGRVPKPQPVARRPPRLEHCPLSPHALLAYVADDTTIAKADRDQALRRVRTLDAAAITRHRSHSSTLSQYEGTLSTLSIIVNEAERLASHHVERLDRSQQSAEQATGYLMMVKNNATRALEGSLDGLLRQLDACEGRDARRMRQHVAGGHAAATSALLQLNGRRRTDAKIGYTLLSVERRRLQANHDNGGHHDSCEIPASEYAHISHHRDPIVGALAENSDGDHNQLEEREGEDGSDSCCAPSPISPPSETEDAMEGTVHFPGSQAPLSATNPLPDTQSSRALHAVTSSDTVPAQASVPGGKVATTTIRYDEDDEDGLSSAAASPYGQPSAPAPTSTSTVAGRGNVGAVARQHLRPGAAVPPPQREGAAPPPVDHLAPSSSAGTGPRVPPPMEGPPSAVVSRSSSLASSSAQFPLHSAQNKYGIGSENGREGNRRLSSVLERARAHSATRLNAQSQPQHAGLSATNLSTSTIISTNGDAPNVNTSTTDPLASEGRDTETDKERIPRRSAAILAPKSLKGRTAPITSASTKEPSVTRLQPTRLTPSQSHPRSASATARSGSQVGAAVRSTSRATATMPTESEKRASGHRLRQSPMPVNRAVSAAPAHPATSTPRAASSAADRPKGRLFEAARELYKGKKTVTEIVDSDLGLVARKVKTAATTKTHVSVTNGSDTVLPSPITGSVVQGQSPVAVMPSAVATQGRRHAGGGSSSAGVTAALQQQQGVTNTPTTVGGYRLKATTVSSASPATAVPSSGGGGRSVERDRVHALVAAASSRGSSAHRQEMPPSSRR